MTGRQPVALTRAVSRSLPFCELTYLPRVPIDVARAEEQHAAYARALGTLGLEVERLPALHDQPDAVFVEDTAVVLDEVVVATRMGAATRRAEVDSVARALARYRPVVRLEGGTLEGGDVLRAGRRIFVGLTDRTDRSGVDALARAVAPHGYTVVPVGVHGCLHLKSACTYIGEDTLLVHEPWVDAGPFAGLRLLRVHPEEAWAANALRIENVVLMADGYPWTLEAVARAGFAVQSIDVSELAKAEAALTCLSLIVERAA